MGWTPPQDLFLDGASGPIMNAAIQRPVESSRLTPTQALSISGRILAGYSAMGVLWIVGSGWWLHRLIRDAPTAAYWITLLTWSLVSATALLLGVALRRNLVEIQRSTVRLKASEERWKHALEGASQAVWDWDAVTNQVFFSDSWKAMLGYGPHEIGNNLEEWKSRVHPDDLPDVLAALERHLNGQSPAYASEHRVRCKDGSYKWILDQGKVMTRTPDGRPQRLLGTHYDITERRHVEAERRQAERLQTLSADVLRILNDPHVLPDAARLILDAIKRDTGIEAVGIRLMKDNHFPYASADGFSEEFLRAENDLTARNCDGTACFDDEGRVMFECTCGLVLSGKTDPTNTLMTPGGSVWSNDARPFLHLHPNEDPRLHPRNRCIREGYQSLALIPIRAEGGIVGLLQLNDRRKDCFSAEMIQYFEGLATSFGVALLRLREVQALRQAEQKHRSLFENSVEGIFQADPNGVLYSTNIALARILGFENQAGLLSAWNDADASAYCGLSGERWKELKSLLEANGVVKDFEVEFRRRSGERIWVSCNVWSVRNTAGGLARYEGTVTDITARKVADTILRDRLELQDQLAKVAATVPGMIFSFRLHSDGSTSMPFCTPAIMELWGLRPEEVRTDCSAGCDRIHPGDIESVRSKIARSARTLNPWQDTFRVRHPRHGERWLSGQSMPRVESDGSILWHGFVQDVTERKLAEEALRLSEERYRNLVETTFEWIWEIDASGHYTFVSPKVQDLLGYTPEEVLGKTPFDLMPESEASRLRQVFADLQGSRQPFSSLENVNRHKDGHLVTLESSAVPMLGPNGELKGYRGMDRDISERKRLEEQFRQAQRLEAIGQLAGGVAHDFNNILAATMMHLGLLQMNPEIDDETRQSLKELETETRRAASLTRQLLMFSRRSVMTVQPVDLSQVVTNLLKMLNRLIGENVSLHFECFHAIPTVEADPGMLEQVVVNLVVNARDAMPKGGRITLGTQLVHIHSDRDGPISDRRSGCFVCLTVSDTGHGMNPETIKHIFEPFFTTKEAGKGTGLGLSTVHGIVAQHKGWVEVESEPGQGSTFRVFIPALHQTPSAATLPLNDPPPHRGHETILIVEDDPSVRSMVRRSLNLLGYHVLEAANGQAAMSLWQTHGETVDLLLTDMVMPEGMTGLELTEKLQSLKPDLHAVISSGYSAEIVHGGVTDQPGIVYLPKPYELDTLANVVRTQLNRSTRTSAGSIQSGGK
jgi:PAS domain S-box-containing protein